MHPSRTFKIIVVSFGFDLCKLNLSFHKTMEKWSHIVAQQLTLVGLRAKLVLVHCDQTRPRVLNAIEGFVHPRVGDMGARCASLLGLEEKQTCAREPTTSAVASQV